MNNDVHLAFRCKNEIAHLRNGQSMDGNIVLFLGKNTLTVRCANSGCRHWTTLQLSLPGIELDLRKAGVSQTTNAPGTLKLNVVKPAVILDQIEEVAHA